MKFYQSTTYKKAIENLPYCINCTKASILVTGACGLIGSCIIDVLMSANKKGYSYTIYALDLHKEDLKERFGEDKYLHFIEQNICNPFITNVDFDYIIHIASYADPVSYALHPVETSLINVIGTNNMLKYCQTHTQTRLLYTSTFEVYGKLEKDIYLESDFGRIDFNQIRACYPESKRTAEILIKSYVEEYGVNAVIVRLCSIYGPTMKKDDSKAHAQFLNSAIQSKDIVLKSKGEQIRSYCYVIDAVSAILMALFKGEKGEVYNISNKKSIVSIYELAQLISNLAGKNIVYENPNAVEQKGFSKPQNCILDSQKLEQLGWQASYDIYHGVEETLKILKEVN